jgi:hypothetical protein
MLRALRLTPEVDLPVPRVEQARVARARLANAERRAAEPRRRRVAASAAAGLRAGAAAGAVGPEGRLGFAWRPDAPGLELQLSVGARSDLEAMGFVGRVADDSLAIAAHVPVLRKARLRLTGAAGVAVHGIRIEGRLGPEAVSILRFDPAIRMGFLAGYEVRRNLDAGIAMSADCLLLRQQYQVAGEALLVVPRLQVSIGLILKLGIL